MTSGVQTDHLMICYCIYEGHLTRFPCFNGPGQYYGIRWNTAILFEEDIGAYFPIEKRQILNPCITPKEKGIHESTFQNLTCKGQIFEGI